MGTPNCFVCTEQIPPYVPDNSDYNSFLLCEILEIPQFVNNEGIRYCNSCVNRIFNIRDMVGELEKLEKKIVDEKYMIGNQLKENSRKEMDEGKTEKNSSTNELRIRVGADLTAKTIQTILKNIGRKQVGLTVNPQRLMENVTIENVSNGRNSGDSVPIRIPVQTLGSEIFEYQELPIYYQGSLAMENHLEVQSNSRDDFEGPSNTSSSEEAWTGADSRSFDVQEGAIDTKSEINSHQSYLCNDLLQDNVVPASEVTAQNYMYDPVTPPGPGTSTELKPNSVISDVEFQGIEFANDQGTYETYRNMNTFNCGIIGTSFDLYNQFSLQAGSSTAKMNATYNKNNDANSRTAEQKQNLKVSPSLRPKKCDECGRILLSLKSWRFHVMQVHRKQYKFKCTLCDFGCQQKSELQAHVLTHLRVKNFECHLCHKAFKVKYGLNAHLKLHK